MAKKQIMTIVKNYIKAVEARNIRVEKAYLFGSYAHGTAKKSSDIDIAVISPDFGKNYMEETCMLLQIARDIDIDIFPDPYSVEEYENAGEGNFLYQEIINKGQLITL